MICKLRVFPHLRNCYYSDVSVFRLEQPLTKVGVGRTQLENKFGYHTSDMHRVAVSPNKTSFYAREPEKVLFYIVPLIIPYHPYRGRKQLIGGSLIIFMVRLKC